MKKSTKKPKKETKDFKSFVKKQTIDNELLGYLKQSEREKLVVALNKNNLGPNYKIKFDKQKLPILAIAVGFGCGTIIKDLINMGADVDSEKGLALMHAISHNDSTIARILLKAGASPNAGSGAILKVAAAQNQLGLLEEMYNFGAKFTEKIAKEILEIAHRHNNYDMMRFISDRIQISSKKAKK